MPANNVIRSLFARLGYQVDNKGAKAFDGQMDRLIASSEQAASRIQSVMAGVGASIAAAFSVGQARDFLDSQDETVTEMQRLSDATGIQVERLQQLGAAARKNGVDFEDFAQGIVDLGVRAFDASTDPGNAYAEVFNRIGLSVTDAGGKLKDSETLYLDFINTLSRTDAATRRFALDEILGDAGTRQSAIAAQGADAFLALANGADAAAQVIGKDAIDATRQLAITQDVLTGSLRQVTNRLLVNLTPAIDGLARRFASFVQDEERVNRALGILRTSVLAVSAAFASAKVGAFASALAGLPGLLLRTAQGATLMGAAIRGAQLAMAALPLAAAGALVFLRDINTMLVGGQSTVGDFLDRYEEADGVLGSVARTLRSASPALGELFNRLSALGERVLPMLESAGGGLVQLLAGSLGRAAEMLIRLLEESGPAIVGAIETIVPKVIEISSTIAALGADLLGRVVPMVADLVGSVLAFAGPVLEAITSLIESAIAIIAPVIPTALAAIGAIVDAIKAILPGATAVFSGVAALVKGLLPVVLPVIALISAAITGIANLLGGTFKWLSGTFGPAASAIIRWFQRIDALISPLLRKVSSLAKRASKIPGLGGLSDLFGGGGGGAPRRDIVGSVLASAERDLQRRAIAASPSMSNAVSATTQINGLTIQTTAPVTGAGARQFAAAIPGALDDEATRRATARGIG